jgi:hypothetical protein
MVAIWKWLQEKFFAPIDLRVPVKEYLYKPGLPLWECNLVTGEIIEAEFETVPSTDRKGKPCIKRKLLMKEKCLYEFAINGDNAVRKFEKRITENILKNG